jgi:tetratricopeptide (TPR) repeat protein
MSDIALTWAKVAGVGGIALFVLLMVFRDVIKKKIFPTLHPKHAFSIIRLIIVCTFLIACVGIATWYLLEARQADLKSEKQKSHTIILTSLLDALAQNAQAAGSEEERARRQKTLHSLLNDPTAWDDLGKALTRIQEVLGSAGVPEAGTALRKLQGGEIGPTVASLRTVAQQKAGEAAEARYLAGILLELQGDFDAALTEYIAASQSRAAEEQYFTKAVGLALNTGKFSTAETLLASRLALASGDLATPEQKGLYLGLSALKSWYQGDLAEAEKQFDRALAVLDGKPSVSLAKVLNDSSPLYRSRGLLDVSKARLSKSAEIYACLADEKDTRYLNTLLNLAAVYVQEGSYGNARAAVQTVLDGVAGAGPTDLPRKFLAAQAHVVLGNLFRAQSELAKAEESLVRALALFGEIRAAWTFSHGRAETYLGAVYLDQKRPDRATARLLNGLASNIRLFGPKHFETGQSFTLLAAASTLQGDLKQGRIYLEQAANALSDKMMTSPQVARTREVEAQIYLREGGASEAARILENTCQIYSRMPVPDLRGWSGCHESLGEVLSAAGRPDEAAAAKERASIIRSKANMDSDPGAVPKSTCKP